MNARRFLYHSSTRAEIFRMYLLTIFFVSVHLVLIVILTTTATATVFATSEQNDLEEDDGNGEWINSCYDSGYSAGQDGPSNHPTYDHCGDEPGGDDAYYNGFSDGCVSVEDNTRDVCESATDA